MGHVHFMIFVGLMYWSLYDFLLGECIGFYNEFEKTQSDNTFQSTLYDFLFCECIGFYNEFEKNHKVAMSTL